MRVEQDGKAWRIVRGRHVDTRTYFAFLVDGVPSWTRHHYNATNLGTQVNAERILHDLRRRVKLKRQRRLL